MNFLQTLLAALAGFLLAATLLPHHHAKAASDSGMIYVQRMPKNGGMVNAVTAVIGFSCAPGKDEVECYIAYRQGN